MTRPKIEIMSPKQITSTNMLSLFFALVVRLVYAKWSKKYRVELIPKKKKKANQRQTFYLGFDETKMYIAQED